jgi:ATP-dependent exoDNAse (exonuclease V) beta subunit
LARHDARAMAIAPSVVVNTVHEWATTESSESLKSASALVEVISLTRPEGETRPGGIAFGLLVHGVLAQAPFDATASDRLELARLDARVLGISEEEVDAAASVVERLFAHDLLVRARAADARGACRRETPVTCTQSDGLVVEGIVDLAFEEQGAWIVVDYKTDRELATAGEDRYRRQVALYASAIAQATGQSATGVLVRV